MGNHKEQRKSGCEPNKNTQYVLECGSRSHKTWYKEQKENYGKESRKEWILTNNFADMSKIVHSSFIKGLKVREGSYHPFPKFRLVSVEHHWHILTKRSGR